MIDGINNNRTGQGGRCGYQGGIMQKGRLQKHNKEKTKIIYHAGDRKAIEKGRPPAKNGRGSPHNHLYHISPKKSR